jgi:hypothetical protein
VSLLKPYLNTKLLKILSTHLLQSGLLKCLSALPLSTILTPTPESKAFFAYALYNSSLHGKEGWLSFKKHGLVRILGPSRESQDWWIGNLAEEGEIGLVQEDWVDKIPAETEEADFHVAQATNDCLSRGEGNLSFLRNDSIHILGPFSSIKGFWRGRVIKWGKSGVVPWNYVDKLPLPQTEKEGFEAHVAQALFDCSTDQAGYLSFKKDDLIHILSPHPNNAWRNARHLIGGQSGLIPTAYFEKLIDVPQDCARAIAKGAFKPYTVGPI